MKRIASPLLFLVLFLGATLPSPAEEDEQPAPRENDFVLIDGVRAGPITNKTTVAELKKLFGEDNCREGIAANPPGEPDGVLMEPNTVYRVFPDTQDELMVVFDAKEKAMLVRLWALRADKDPETGEVSRMKMVRTRTRWHTKNGLTLDQSVAEVTKINGGPFVVHGWESDSRRGEVFDWKGGKIPEEFRLGFTVTKQKNYEEAWAEVTSGDGWNGLSDGPIIPKLGLVVTFIEINL